MLTMTFCINIDPIEIVAIVAIGSVIIAISGLVLCTQIHPFLAKNAPIAADVLVVEGWLPDSALQSAAVEFKQGGYQQLITIGSAIPRGLYLSEYHNFAELAAATLIAIGVDPLQISIVADPSLTLGRTASNAVLLDRWLATSELEIAALNLFTLSTHARRSWLLFANILAPRQIAVGIIAAEPLNYDYHRWWHSSEGFRTVISELLAYLYVRIGNL